MRGTSASLDWFGVCEGCGRLGIQPRAAPSATLSSMFWCLQWKCWRNIRWADTFCGQWLFPWSFFFLASLALVWSLMLGGCSSVIGRQWKACLGCLCCGLVPADEIKQQSDPVTTLSHILQTCFAWPTLFLALCSSPGLFYIDRLTIFSPSLSLPCLVCEYKPKCLPKVENRWHFSVFRAYEILKDFWENNVVWGGVKISIRLSFLSAESWHWVL